jgi:hypothetical protein
LRFQQTYEIGAAGSLARIKVRLTAIHLLRLLEIPFPPLVITLFWQSRGTLRVPSFMLPTMIGSLEVEVQPDGGEGLVKRKGAAVRQGLKEAWSKTLTDKKRIMRPTRPDKAIDLTSGDLCRARAIGMKGSQGP